VKRLHIGVDCGGGFVTSALRIAQGLERLRAEFGTEIVTYNFGKVCSAANYIYLAGDVRYCDEHSVFMQHEMRFSGKTRHELFMEFLQLKWDADRRRVIEQGMADLDQKVPTCKEMYRRKTMFSATDIDRMFSSTVCHNQIEAIAFGLSNKVGSFPPSRVRGPCSWP
jgi:ATP-dependent protease ClpP protease subunit